tara:strand:+ start:332 stop:1042 length:711 start_codon:yes stop_codon:yes gene_type:complete
VLGLGNSLSLSGVVDGFSMLSTSPDLWLKFNTGQTILDSDSDGDSDVQWADSSGNGNDATSAEDAKQGSFSDGAWSSADNSDHLVLDSNITLADDYTIFIVFTVENTSDTFIGGPSTDDFMRFGQGENAAAMRTKHSGNVTNFTFDTNPSTGKGMFKISRNADGDEFTVTQNSTTVLIDAASVNGSNFVANKIPAGGAGLAEDYLWEVVIYNRAVTAGESALIEADILTRTSLTAD